MGELFFPSQKFGYVTNNFERQTWRRKRDFWPRGKGRDFLSVGEKGEGIHTECGNFFCNKSYLRAVFEYELSAPDDTISAGGKYGRGGKSLTRPIIYLWKIINIKLF